MNPFSKGVFVQFISVFLALVFLSFNARAVDFQQLIDQAKKNSVVNVPPGTYVGNFTINKSLTIDGHGKAILDGNGTGTVLTVTADRVTIKNMKITGSGDQHNKIDAGIVFTSSYNKVLNTKIYNTLFGIDLKQSHYNQILDNDISSMPVDLGLRGDGIRVWASNYNTFKRNIIHDSRDMVIWYSFKNVIEDNQGWNNRYSLHFMYTGATEVRRNRYKNSAVGIFLMYSRDSIIEENDILFSYGGTGMGIGLKEVDNMVIRKNRIVYSTIGIYMDQSPYKPTAHNLIIGNTIAYNHQGIVLHSNLKNNVFKGNAIMENLEDVVVHANDDALNNRWIGNYWGRYEGFDRNDDQYGDKPYKLHLYQGQLWAVDPWVKFFYASPVLSLVNFLAKLAPFSEPKLLLVDEKPVFSLKSGKLHSKANLHFDISDLNLELEDDEDDVMVDMAGRVIEFKTPEFESEEKSVQ